MVKYWSGLSCMAENTKIRSLFGLYSMIGSEKSAWSVWERRIWSLSTFFSSHNNTIVDF